MHQLKEDQQLTCFQILLMIDLMYKCCLKMKYNMFQVVDVFVVLVALFSGAPSPWAVVKGSHPHCKKLRGNLGGIRPHSVTITEFGAVGDGVTLNTKAFQNAIFYLNSFTDKGGAKLFVPSGRWLTGSFHLISHLTLWLDKDAVILGSTVIFHFSLLPKLEN